MKNTALPLILITLASINTPAMAAEYQDNAQVISSTPIYESVNEPQRECWDEQVGFEQEQQPHNVGRAIVGSLLGGVLGHQIGKGTGRELSTVIGAATGAIVGANAGNNRPVATTPKFEQRCRQIDNWRRHLTGYDVIYRYHGQEFTAFLPKDPGPWVRVNVNVSLAEQ